MFGKIGGSNLFSDKKSQKNDSKASTGLFGMPAPGATGATSGFGVVGGDISAPSSFSAMSQSVFGSQGNPSATSSALFGAKPALESSQSTFTSFTSPTGNVFGKISPSKSSEASINVFQKELKDPSSTAFVSTPSEPVSGSGSLFNKPASTFSSSSLFGKAAQPASVDTEPKTGSLFGKSSPDTGPPSLFGKPAPPPSVDSGPPAGQAGSLFGKPSLDTGPQSLFGKPVPDTGPQSGQTLTQAGQGETLFGKSVTETGPQSGQAETLFGKSSFTSGEPQPTGGGLFGSDTLGPRLFGTVPSSLNKSPPSTKSGMGLFSQSSIKRSVGTRPNTPVFDNAEDEGNVDDQYEDEDDNNEDYDNEDDDGNEYDNNEDDNDYGYEEDEGKITRTISPFQSGPSLFSAPKAQTDQGVGLFGKTSGESSGSIFSRLGASASDGDGLFKRPRDEVVESEPSKKSKRGATAKFLEQVREEAPVSSPSVKSKLRRTVSKEELATITSIRCEQVPDEINNSAVLTKHFSQFGNLSRVVPNTRKKTAIVHFQDHASAKLAKAKGKIVEDSLIGHIFYSQSSPRSKLKRKAATEEDQDKDGAGVGIFTKPSKKMVKPAAMSQNIDSSNEFSSNLSSSNTSSVSELTRIMKQQALSDEDRWKILDARDKYMKLKFPKSQLRSGLEIEDMNLIGTCPDLCPEKERYGRSTKNQLRRYEKIGGNLNHLAAVKEHSRSAADQDVPPPHELRPPKILSMTMDFLMCNIVDRIDNMGAGTMEDWFQFIDQPIVPSDPWSQFYSASTGGAGDTGETVGDWYEYMWSVTRAIRKDITQQNLTDLVSLSIVEKCARFHIFCAERLCEESAFNFDKKLNDENLTKCLRTLKHMYHDLEESGVRCPNEAEFRCYDVLMNLNEGDTLREIQNLPDELQLDERVQFALNCFKVLDTNNYIRFFKLVKETSYLEACILKRYFYQVRRKALDTIVRAYVPGKQMIQFPVSKIHDWLAFETEMECRKFLRAHGLESEDGIIFLERASLMHPETPPPVMRAKWLIESKKNVSYGEIVNGGKLGDNPYLEYYPHDSFDDNGFLKKEAYDAQDQFVVDTTAEETFESELDEETRILHSEISKSFGDEVMEDVLEEEVEKLSKDVLRIVYNEIVSIGIFNEIQAEVVHSIAQEVTKEVFKESRNKLIAEKLLVEEKLEQQREACSKVVDDWIDEIVSDFANEEMKEVNHQRKLQKYMNQASNIANDLISDLVNEEVIDIAKQVIVDVEKEKAAKVELFQTSRKQKILRKTFREWRKLAYKSKRNKDAIVNFPATVAYLSSDQQNAQLGWGRNKVERNRIPVADIIARRKEIEVLMKAKDIQNCLIESAILEPFHLQEMFDSCHLGIPQWKLIFATPDIHEDSQYNTLLQMIKSKFKGCFPGKSNDEFLIDHALYENLSVIVKEVGPKLMSILETSKDARSETLSGVAAIMFLNIEDEPTDFAQSRLQKLFELKSNVPSSPLLVLSSKGLEETSQDLRLQEFVSDGVISSYDVVQVSPDIFNLDMLVSINQGVKRLISNSPTDLSPGYSSSSLNNFVEDFIVDKVFSAFFINQKDRRERDIPDRPSEELISLYNTALDHCIDVLQDDDLSNVCLPTANNTDQLVDKIEALKLPDIVVHDSSTWKNIVDQILVYVNGIYVPGYETSIVVSNIRRSLARSFRSFNSRCQERILLDHSSSFPAGIPPLELLPWTDIVHHLIVYKLSTISGNDNVWFNTSLIQNWTLPSSWTRGLCLGEERLMDSVSELVNSSVLEAKERSFAVLDQSDTTPCLHPGLKEAIKEEQKSSLRLEKLLENALNDQTPPEHLKVPSPTKRKSESSLVRTPEKISTTPSRIMSGRLSTSPRTAPVRLDVEHKVQGLHLNIEQERMENARLEQMLKMALN